MIACVHAQRFIPLLHDDELDGPLRREIQEHVVTCMQCTRALAFLERGQELLRLTIDEQIEDIEFSGFWEGVENKLSVQQPTWWWRVRRQLWWDAWRPFWSWPTPVWATMMAVLFIGLVTLLWQRHATLIPTPPLVPSEPFVISDNDQAQIESLSASDTVSVWNEPTNNSTVIWVSDEGEGGLP